MQCDLGTDWMTHEHAKGPERVETRALEVNVVIKILVTYFTDIFYVRQYYGAIDYSSIP